jgi:hypothetical protein
MNDIFDNFDDADNEPFAPAPAPIAKKRGRPASAPAAAKPKPKIAKPKYIIPIYRKTDVVEALMIVAAELAPPSSTYSDKLRIAADLLDMIEKAKA